MPQHNEKTQILYAWYGDSDFFREYSVAGFGGNKAPTPVLGKTHFKVPANMVLHIDRSVDLIDQIGDAFRHFNWVDHDFMAPDEVNDFARQTNTHASMSVGDIVQVGAHYFICENSGWSELTNIRRTQESLNA